MCGCFAVLLGAFFPRLVTLGLWIFTDYVTRAFHGEWLVPLIGIIFLPYTTLVYTLVYVFSTPNGVYGFGWFLVAFAFVVDIGAWVGGGRSANQRRTAAPPPQQGYQY